MHGGRVAPNAKVASQQRQASVRLAPAEGHWIGWKLLVNEAVRVELAIGAAISVDVLKVRERDSHHAGPNAKSPTVAAGRLRTHSGVHQRLLGRGQSELMCSGGELE